jgi:predicted phage baseplate assembly protein
MFFGNLLLVYEGRPMTVRFYESGSVLPTDTAALKHLYYHRMNRYGDAQGDWVLAELPDDGTLAYRTPISGLAPNGEEPAHSTLKVTIEPGGGAATESWDEVESLVHSDDSAENGDHYMVETDEHRLSIMRFGNDRNGRLLPLGAIINAEYQIGGGLQGNVGADRLIYPQPLIGPLSGVITATWNLFDVTDGREPESPDKVRRNAPEAYRARQLRAVTLADYVKRAEEVPGVSRAVARYAWTGSWRTVRVIIDPKGTTVLDDKLRTSVAAHLEAVRLIGEDLELRAPRFVPLDIRITVCAEPNYWREDLRFVLEQEFSDGWTADGRPGFFNVDLWTFGQTLHRSAIEGRIHRVPGIRHVMEITMKRFNAPTPGVLNTEVLEMGFDEVILLSNDPDHLERGLIRFDVKGGRQ